MTPTSADDFGPPRWAERLAGLRLPRDRREFVLGDMDEEFKHRASHQGRAEATRWYRRQAWRTALGRHPRILAPPGLTTAPREPAMVPFFARARRPVRRAWSASAPRVHLRGRAHARPRRRRERRGVSRRVAGHPQAAALPESGSPRPCVGGVRPRRHVANEPARGRELCRLAAGHALVRQRRCLHRAAIDARPDRRRRPGATRHALRHRGVLPGVQRRATTRARLHDRRPPGRQRARGAQRARVASLLRRRRLGRRPPDSASEGSSIRWSASCPRTSVSRPAC